MTKLAFWNPMCGQAHEQNILDQVHTSHIQSTEMPVARACESGAEFVGSKLAL